MASKVHHPREYWEQKVQEWLCSGKNARAWCSEHQVPYSTFLSWRQRLQVSEESQEQLPMALACSPSKERWEQKVQEWLCSGKSARTWCSEHQVPYTTFLSWRKRLQVSERSKYSQVQQQENATPSTYVQGFVELTDRVVVDPGIYLEYAGVKIHLSTSFDPIVLQRCLSVVRGVSC